MAPSFLTYNVYSMKALLPDDLALFLRIDIGELLNLLNGG